MSGSSSLIAFDQRHAIGLDLVGRLGGLARVFDLYKVRRAVVLEPGTDAYPGEALGDELQLAVFAAGVVHLYQRAVLRQRRGIEVAVVFWRGIHEEQGQAVVWATWLPSPGFLPKGLH
ncbi:hypothetical protein PPS11_20993 [Pseudomonas putida S11]|nr:hypothetical protein PPS11_20993 [Pseudomonas putida S11]